MKNKNNKERVIRKGNCWFVFSGEKEDLGHFPECPLLICRETKSPLDNCKLSLVSWDDKEKQYYVRVTFKENLGNVHELIRSIAQNARCSCGHELVLSSHTIQLLEDGLYIFSGIYKCPVCKDPKPTAMQYIKLFLSKLKLEGKLFGVKINLGGDKID